MSNRPVAPGFYEMAVLAPKIAAGFLPGQFVMVRVDAGLEPLLRRPLGIAAAVEKGKGIMLIYRVVGEGTQILSERAAGEKINVCGPLGRPFTIGSGAEKHVLVAGGCGVPPLIALLGALKNKRKSKTVFLYGAKTKDMLAGMEHLNGANVKFIFATEDGSFGKKGLVTGLLEKELTRRCRVHACGPAPMLRAVAEMCKKKRVPCELSLEARMACGIGACQGCVVRVRTSGGAEEYRRVCKEGPVFRSEECEIVWDGR
jgi:dihydroorotate dehydrogenase electron transfer subunit